MSINQIYNLENDDWFDDEDIQKKKGKVNPLDEAIRDLFKRFSKLRIRSRGYGTAYAAAKDVEESFCSIVSRSLGHASSKPEYHRQVYSSHNMSHAWLLLLQVFANTENDLRVSGRHVFGVSLAALLASYFNRGAQEVHLIAISGSTRQAVEIDAAITVMALIGAVPNLAKFEAPMDMNGIDGRQWEWSVSRPRELGDMTIKLREFPDAKPTTLGRLEAELACKAQHAVAGRLLRVAVISAPLNDLEPDDNPHQQGLEIIRKVLHLNTVRAKMHGFCPDRDFENYFTSQCLKVGNKLNEVKSGGIFDSRSFSKAVNEGAAEHTTESTLMGKLSSKARSLVSLSPHKKTSNIDDLDPPSTNFQDVLASVDRSEKTGADGSTSLFRSKAAPTRSKKGDRRKTSTGLKQQQMESGKEDAVSKASQVSNSNISLSTPTKSVSKSRSGVYEHSCLGPGDKDWVNELVLDVTAASKESLPKDEGKINDDISEETIRASTIPAELQKKLNPPKSEQAKTHGLTIDSEKRDALPNRIIKETEPNGVADNLTEISHQHECKEGALSSGTDKNIVQQRRAHFSSTKSKNGQRKRNKSRSSSVGVEPSPKATQLQRATDSNSHSRTSHKKQLHTSIEDSPIRPRMASTTSMNEDLPALLSDSD